MYNSKINTYRKYILIVKQLANRLLIDFDVCNYRKVNYNKSTFIKCEQ